MTETAEQTTAEKQQPEAMKTIRTLPKPIEGGQIEIMRSAGAFASMDTFKSATRMANALVSSSLVPKEYQGRDNLGNALIALEISQRIGASPLMVMQNLYIVHGKPAWSSQFIIAALNGCGRYEPLEFVYVGKEGTSEWGCYVTTTVKKTGKELKGPTVTIDMASKEGWLEKAGSKWQTMPEIMLGYRAASFFGKRYAPDILMGMQSAEEVRDIGPQEFDVTPEEGASTADLNAALLGTKAGDKAASEATPADAEEADDKQDQAKKEAAKEVLQESAVLAADSPDPEMMIMNLENATSMDELEEAFDLCRELKGGYKTRAQQVYQGMAKKLAEA